MTDEASHAKLRADALRETLQRQSADLEPQDELRQQVRRVIDALDRVRQNLSELEGNDAQRK